MHQTTKHQDLNVISREIAKKGTTSVTILGWEKSELKDLCQRLQALKSLVTVPLTLTGLIDPKWTPAEIKMLSQSGIKKFAPLVFGNSPEIQAYFTGLHYSLEKLFQIIMQFKVNRIKCTPKVIINRSTFRHLPAIAKLLTSLRCKEVEWVAVRLPFDIPNRFYSETPRYSMVSEYLESALTVTNKARIKSWFRHIPQCAVPDIRVFFYGSEEFIWEIEGAELTSNRHTILWEPEAIQGKPCQECAVRNKCPGIPYEYAEIYGWSEVEPVKGK